MILAAIALCHYDKSSGLVNLTLFVILGMLWIGQGVYHHNYGNTIIGWDDKSVTLKFPDRKAVIYKKETIKNLTLTQKHFIINAGLGDGEMVELNIFCESDKVKLRAFQRFQHKNASGLNSKAINNR